MGEAARSQMVPIYDVVRQGPRRLLSPLTLKSKPYVKLTSLVVFTPTISSGSRVAVRLRSPSYKNK